MAASTYLTVALGLVVSALIARGLGPADFGQYAYVIWLSGFLVVVANNGLGISGIRFISECLGKNDSAQAANIHGWLQRWQWLSIAVVAGVFVLVLPFLKPAGWHGTVTVLACVVIVSFASKAAYLFQVSIAKGHGHFNIEAWSTMLMSVIYTAGIAAMALTRAPLAYFLIFFAVVSAAHIVVIRFMLRHDGIRAAYGPCEPLIMERLKPHLLWTVVQVAIATLGNKTFETYLLNTQVGAAEVGYFALASNLTRGAVELVSSSLTTMLMPALAHAYGAGGIRQVNVLLGDAVRYCLFLGLVVAGVGVLWSDLGVYVMYGAQYGAVVDVLRIMVLIGGCTLADSAFGALLSITDNQRQRAAASLIFVVSSAVSAFLLVPQYGLTGAMLSNAISRIIVFIVLASAALQMPGIALPWRKLTKLALAALGAAAIAAAIVMADAHALSQFLAGTVYLLIFVWLTLRLNAWEAKDAELLINVIDRKPALLNRLRPWAIRWRDKAQSN